MSDLLVALGLFLVIEGVLYALFPGQIRRLAKAIENVSDGSLRGFGLFAVLLGFALVWAIRGS